MDILNTVVARNFIRKEYIKEQNYWVVSVYNSRNVALTERMMNEIIIYLSFEFFKTNYENLPDKLLYFNDKLPVEHNFNKKRYEYPFYLMYISTFMPIKSLNKYIIFIFASSMEFKLPMYLKYLCHSYIYIDQFIYNDELLYLICCAPFTNLYPRYLTSMAIQYNGWSLMHIDNQHLYYLCSIKALDENRRLNKII
jgi:hypothetical protein